jgi:hypothetical protein
MAGKRNSEWAQQDSAQKTYFGLLFGPFTRIDRFLIPQADEFVDRNLVHVAGEWWWWGKFCRVYEGWDLYTKRIQEGLPFMAVVHSPSTLQHVTCWLGGGKKWLGGGENGSGVVKMARGW